MITEGIQVQGLDMKGNPIQGTVENILRTFQVAIVRIGEDRTHISQAYISDLKEIAE